MSPPGLLSRFDQSGSDTVDTALALGAPNHEGTN